MEVDSSGRHIFRTRRLGNFVLLLQPLEGERDIKDGEVAHRVDRAVDKHRQDVQAEAGETQSFKD